MAAILLAGFVAFLQLPVSALPEVDYPTIQVATFYPGASPDVKPLDPSILSSFESESSSFPIGVDDLERPTPSFDSVRIDFIS